MVGDGDEVKDQLFVRRAQDGFRDTAFVDGVLSICTIQHELDFEPEPEPEPETLLCGMQRSACFFYALDGDMISWITLAYNSPTPTPPLHPNHESEATRVSPPRPLQLFSENIQAGCS